MGLKLEPGREHLQLALAAVPAGDAEVGVLAANLHISTNELPRQAGAREERDPDLMSRRRDDESQDRAEQRGWWERGLRRGR